MKHFHRRMFCALLAASLSFSISIFSVSKDRYARIQSGRPIARKKLASGISGVVKYTFETNRNIFSSDSMKILTAGVPLYIGARGLDKIFNTVSYEPNGHKNVNQIPKFLYHTTNEGVVICMAAMLGSSLWLSDEHAVLVGHVFSGGILSVWGTKNLIKKIDIDANLRPLNERFSSENRAYGGFPSGHSAITMYTAVLFGLQYGRKAGIPLGIFTGLSFIIGANANRHYISQLIGGIALGAIYGIASSKVVDSNMPKLSSKRWDVGMSLDKKGRPMLGVSYDF